MKLTVFRSNRRLHNAHQYRTLVNGEDVTDRCQEADDRRGEALLLKHDESGLPFMKSGRVAKEVVRGRVEFVRR